ncbi:hypothetical protein SAMN05192560_1816 [Methylobacillus rhizosphaerae]|uniref:Uncharacterized protein n=1 Tax=Methylobacillus rhizosphaerae TaxID=551994 RepID=A0A239AD32_9PROT|nr:hypothetical protein [Methylobacillus rhizosphaerae]SNR93282.1 hypothetical protein SAMN05192560_1816 [Methylobacillus rhizosphaerae]
MSYTKEIFSHELEVFLVGDELDHSRIAEWAYATKLKHVRGIDRDVDQWLEELGAMDMGEEFKLSLAELQRLVAIARQ